MSALHCPACDGQAPTCTRCTRRGEQHPTDDELTLAHVQAQLAQVTAERDRALAAIETQRLALRQFEVANKASAMARAPQQLKDAARLARENEAGVQEANAILTEEVERLTAQCNQVKTDADYLERRLKAEELAHTKTREEARRYRAALERVDERAGSSPNEELLGAIAREALRGGGE